MNQIPADVNQMLESSNWIALRELGRGGGGVVYLTIDRRLAGTMHVAAEESVGNVGSHTIGGKDALLSSALESLVENLLRTLHNSSALAAVKIPHAEMVIADRKRLVREVEAMKAFQHSSLIRLLDHDGDDPIGWFAVEYHQRGTLDSSENCDRYRGKPVDILQALLPLAKALSIIHGSSFVHRDVKPKNIFVADDGHLVLGDFGVVLPGVDATRLTKADPAHSRDWVPDWVQFGQERTYAPAVDVFALAKVAHYLLDGENVMASQMPHRLKVLQQKYAGVSGLVAMLSFLERCIVTDEHALSIVEGGALAREITRIVTEEEAKAQSRPERFEIGQGHTIPISFSLGIDEEQFSVVIADYYRVTVMRERGPICQGLRWHGRLLGDHIFDSRWPVNAEIYAELEWAINLELWRHRR